MYHWIVNTPLQTIVDCFIDDVIGSQNRSKLWTPIALSKFELEKRSKAQNVGNWTGYQKFKFQFHIQISKFWQVRNLWLPFHPSVRLSVRLSVTPFWLCSHHHIIMEFSGVITNDQSKVHAKGQGQRSKVKVTDVTTQLNRFRTVTPVWIHIWWWNDAYSLMLLRRGALLFFKVIRQISRSHGSKNCRIWPRLGVSGL